MWADVRAAFSFLTIIPLGYGENRQPGWSFAWYPLVGLFIGGCLALTAHFSPYTPNLTAALVLIIWVILTGGLHLDGFGDACDGVLATVDPPRRLDIMKDPRTGSWAVIGLVLLLIAKWSAIPTITPLLLFVPPIIGRWVMVLAAYAFPYARSTGLGGYFRQGLGQLQVALASGITVISVSVIVRDVLLVAILLATAGFVVMVLGRWTARRLGGGITGDVYGALCELTELVSLLLLTIPL